MSDPRAKRPIASMRASAAPLGVVKVKQEPKERVEVDEEMVQGEDDAALKHKAKRPDDATILRHGNVSLISCVKRPILI
jgi:hypothetical protein